MKKTIFIAVLIFAAIFNGYSQENLANIILGKWKVDSLMINLDQGDKFIYTNLSSPELFSDTLIYTFKRDGSGSFATEKTYAGFSIPFTWKIVLDNDTPKAYLVMSWKLEGTTTGVVARLYFADLSIDPSFMLVYIQYEDEDGFRINSFRYLR